MSDKAFQFFPLQRTHSQRPYIWFCLKISVWSLQCIESYYGKSIRHLDVRSGEHIGGSALTGKKVKPTNNSVVYDQLLHCNFLPAFLNFSILAHENKKYLLEIKESLLIMRHKPSLNRKLISHLCTCLIKSTSECSLFHVSLFNVVSLFNFKYHYKTLKKNCFPVLNMTRQ